MKTRLTLTVNNDVILKARKYSKATGKSISRLFEDFIQKAIDVNQKTESQIAAKRLLKRISASKPVKTVDDKTLIKKTLIDKYG